jgi:hypothetical protein
MGEVREEGWAHDQCVCGLRCCAARAWGVRCRASDLRAPDALSVAGVARAEVRHHPLQRRLRGGRVRVCFVVIVVSSLSWRFPSERGIIKRSNN